MPWHGKLTSKNEARCCAASRLPRPPPESCTRSHHRGDCQRLQAASFNAPRLHDGKRPSADMQTVDMIKRQFNDAALADVAVSSSDTEKQRSKKKKKRRNFSALTRFTWTASHWFFLPLTHLHVRSGPKTKQIRAHFLDVCWQTTWSNDCLCLVYFLTSRWPPLSLPARLVASGCLFWQRNTFIRFQTSSESVWVDFHAVVGWIKE